MSVEVAAGGNLSPLLTPPKVSDETGADFAVCCVPLILTGMSWAVPKMFSSFFDGYCAEVCFSFTPRETISDPTEACMKESVFEEDFGGVIRDCGSMGL